MACELNEQSMDVVQW